MKLDKLVIIDWLSPSTHENFNRSFIEALSGSFQRMYVYEKFPSLNDPRVTELKRPHSRWQHAMQILTLVAKDHSNDPVLLLSYDQKFIPLFRPFFKRILAFEHNTTPEAGALKNVLWQATFTRSLRRLAQFPQQQERLSDLKQRVRYLGSPLSHSSQKLTTATSDSPIFLLPSARSDPMALVPFLTLFEGTTLVSKAASESFIESALQARVRVDVRKSLEFHENGFAVSGVIVTVPSPIRGSGWVNDAIGNAIPVISTTEASTEIISRTFPGLEFIQLHGNVNREAFRDTLRNARQQDHSALIEANNRSFQSALEEELAMLT